MLNYAGFFVPAMISGAMLILSGSDPVETRTDSHLSVIPMPLSLVRDDGAFTLRMTTSIIYSGEPGDLPEIANSLAARIRSATGFPVPVKSGPGRRTDNAIVLLLSENEKLGPEGYKLTVTKSSVLIEASRAAGIFYGVQTLDQLFPPELDGSQLAKGVDWQIPCVRIEDRPRFSWRGMHLDVARHFFTKDSVKRFIDLMASYKFNVFHWHLTDDQGWRIEIKKYPKLTSVGAWRRETMGDCTRHGGFFTQDEVREVVRYAKARFVTVVPEIEMPGHSQAALAAYPELSCSGGPFKVATEWGIINDVYCAGSEKTFQFIGDVIDEVASLFPGPFFHIGGDECPKLRWSNCKRCQDRISSLGLKNEQELQSYFVKRVEKMLSAKGKRLVGWDEILEGGLAPNATVMSWRGIDGGIEAAKSGHDVVMTPTSHCYFDYYQGSFGEPAAIGGFLPIDTVYSYEPVPPDLSPREAEHVLGAQGNLWSEWMPNFRQVEYMAATRMLALSEVVWSDKSHRNFADFMLRMTPQYQRLALRDINFRVPTPLGIGGRRIISHDTAATIINPVVGARILYTLDGQDPTGSSSEYTKPVSIKRDVVLKSVLMLPGGKISNPVTTYFQTVDPGVNNVAYKYFEGEWDVLPDMNALVPVRTGIGYDIALEGIAHRNRNYGLQFNCLVDIPADGEFVFTLGSDDGSKLFVDDRQVIDNDGLHGMTEVTGKVTLARGKHRLEVRYFQRKGGQDLIVWMEGPGMPKQPLAPRMLTLR